MFNIDFVKKHPLIMSGYGGYVVLSLSIAGAIGSWWALLGMLGVGAIAIVAMIGLAEEGDS